jgi:hypothetical protein
MTPLLQMIDQAITGRWDRSSLQCALSSILEVACIIEYVYKFPHTSRPVITPTNMFSLQVSSELFFR